MSKKSQAVAVHGRALAAQKRGDLIEAIALFREAIALGPGWSAPVYNLALLYKQERNWKESLKYNRQATALDPKNEAAWWNQGIAATALGRWQLARAAWRGYGIDVPEGQGPLDLPCGFGPIRLHPEGNAEVVWAYRLDPARAELASIPLPESEHRWRDVVLNDGAPVGYRQYQGKQLPVFNALALLQPSCFGTYVAEVALPPEPRRMVQLAECAARLDGSAEDWSTSIQMLCKACSEGRPHEKHDTDAAPGDGRHLIAIAARDRSHAREILSTWEAEAGAVHVEALEEVLAPGSTGGAS